MSHCYVFGLGSPYGWDQLGWLAVDRLSDLMGKPKGVTLQKLAQPMDMFSVPLAEGDRLVIIDAILDDFAKGDIRWLRVEQLPSSVREDSTHGIGLKSVIDLLRNSGLPSVRIDILGATVPHDACENHRKAGGELREMADALARRILASSQWKSFRFHDVTP